MFLAHLYLWSMSHSHFILTLHVGGGKPNFSHFQGTLLLELCKDPGAYRVKKLFGPQPLLCSSVPPQPISGYGDI